MMKTTLSELKDADFSLWTFHMVLTVMAVGSWLSFITIWILLFVFSLQDHSLAIRLYSKIPLPIASIGSTGLHLQTLTYLPSHLAVLNSTTTFPASKLSEDQALIQASLHADELPGMLVVNHLIRLLDAADQAQRLLKRIVLLPYANPVGLQQVLLGSAIGRFSLSTGVNFNRDFPLVTEAIVRRVERWLRNQETGYDSDTEETFTSDSIVSSSVASNLTSSSNSIHNSTTCTPEMIGMIRAMMLEILETIPTARGESVMKKELLKLGLASSLVLDLHCDSDAVLHMYTHDNLWPAMSDVAELLGTRCILLAPDSGGLCFDEACSCPWAALQERFPFVPMACESATVELRGESDVTDELAEQDAKNIFHLLIKRGYVAPATDEEFALLIPSFQAGAQLPVFPLTGVDMMEAEVPGVILWKVQPGEHVVTGQLLGEIVRVDELDAPRLPIRARTSGVVFSRQRLRLAVPGGVVIKVAGKEELPWRSGDNLLTAR